MNNGLTEDDNRYIFIFAMPMPKWQLTLSAQFLPANRDGPPSETICLDGHIRHICFCQLGDFAVSIRFDRDVHGDRSLADVAQFRPKTDAIADEHGLVEFNALHGNGDEILCRKLVAGNFVAGSDRSCLIDIAEDHAAEDRAVGIRIPRHHHDFQREITVGGLIGQDSRSEKSATANLSFHSTGRPLGMIESAT